MTLLGLLALGVHGSVFGALITSVSIEDEPVPIAGLAAERMINGSGLTGAGTVFGAGVHDGDAGTTQWLVAGPPQTVTFNLGGNYNLDGLHVWNAFGNGVTNRGVQDVTILVSPDGDVSNLVSIGSFTFTEADFADNPNYAGELVDLSSFALADNARLIRFNITSNYGNATRTSLAEVQFSGVVIPEPSSFALLLGGLGLFAGRRRRQ